VPAARDPWPALPLAEWEETRGTLHMVTQILGKLKLALLPMEPQWGQVPLWVTPRGFTTGPLPADARTFAVHLDLVDHALAVVDSDGGRVVVPLRPPVATIYTDLMHALGTLGISVPVSTLPSEVPDPIPFPEDTTHDTYDAEAVVRFRRVIALADMTLREFRADFRGRTTPVSFWWGSFDLAVTRFSGRPVSPPEDAGPIERLGGDAEQACAGFWPGDARFPEPAFFAYVYPQLDGYGAAPVEPGAAFWSDALGEFILRYDDVRQTREPHREILAFCRSTYEAAATLADWDRAALEPAAAG
jgi:hypothetical protein